MLFAQKCNVPPPVPVQVPPTLQSLLRHCRAMVVFAAILTVFVSSRLGVNGWWYSCNKTGQHDPVVNALWNFYYVVRCATQRFPLCYNDYGCWCGKGNYGKPPVDDIDRYSTQPRQSICALFYIPLEKCNDKLLNHSPAG